MAASFVLSRLPEFLGATPGFVTLEQGRVCATLEDPWKDNLPHVSCIPQGVYRLGWTFSQRFQRHTIEILQVPNRIGIRLHAGNTIEHTTGCPLTASELIIEPERVWAQRSEDALKRLEQLFHSEMIREIIVL